MSSRQLYRLRTPSTGREVLLAAEEGRTYLDRDTGEPMEIVGQVLPSPPSTLVAPVVGREPPLLQLVRPARAEGPQRLPHVRPPHGRAAPLTFRSACASGAHPSRPSLLVVAAFVAGCGGSEVPARRGPRRPGDADRPRGRAARRRERQRLASSDSADTSTDDDDRRRGDHRRRHERRRRRPRPTTRAAARPRRRRPPRTTRAAARRAPAPTDDAAAAPDTGGTRRHVGVLRAERRRLLVAVPAQHRVSPL